MERRELERIKAHLQLGLQAVEKLLKTEKEDVSTSPFARKGKKKQLISEEARARITASVMGK